MAWDDYEAGQRGDTSWPNNNHPDYLKGLKEYRQGMFPITLAIWVGIGGAAILAFIDDVKKGLSEFINEVVLPVIATGTKVATWSLLGYVGYRLVQKLKLRLSINPKWKKDVEWLLAAATICVPAAMISREAYDFGLYINKLNTYYEKRNELVKLTAGSFREHSSEIREGVFGVIFPRAGCYYSCITSERWGPTDPSVFKNYDVLHTKVDSFNISTGAFESSYGPYGQVIYGLALNDNFELVEIAKLSYSTREGNPRWMDIKDPYTRRVLYYLRGGKASGQECQKSYDNEICPPPNSKDGKYKISNLEGNFSITWIGNPIKPKQYIKQIVPPPTKAELYQAKIQEGLNKVFPEIEQKFQAETRRLIIDPLTKANLCSFDANSNPYPAVDQSGACRYVKPLTRQKFYDLSIKESANYNITPAKTSFDVYVSLEAAYGPIDVDKLTNDNIDEYKKTISVKYKLGLSTVRKLAATGHAINDEPEDAAMRFLERIARVQGYKGSLAEDCTRTRTAGHYSCVFNLADKRQMHLELEAAGTLVTRPEFPKAVVVPTPPAPPDINKSKLILTPGRG